MIREKKCERIIEKYSKAKKDGNGESDKWCDPNDDGCETLYKDVPYMCASCSSTIYRMVFLTIHSSNGLCDALFLRARAHKDIVRIDSSLLSEA